MDLDVIADIDPTTGQPRFEDRPRALRWIEALDEDPHQAIKHQQKSPTHMETNSSQTKATHTLQPNKAKPKKTPAITPPEAVDLALVEQVLNGLGYRCEWPEQDMLAAVTDTHHFVVQIIEHIPMILMAEWVELVENLPPQDALRFANRLNDTIWGARFKLMEPSSEDLQCSPDLPPDNNPLWVEVELHYGAGLVPIQVAKSAAILAKAIEEAIDIGIEQGVVDPGVYYEVDDADEWSPHWSTKRH
jgi:hypothetical protein